MAAEQKAIIERMVFKRSGRWIPDLDLSDGADHHMLAADYMRERIPSFQRSVAPLMPQSIIAYEFLANATRINACAVQSGHDSCVYLIGVYGGLVIETMKMFSDAIFLKSVRDDLTSLADVDDETLSLFCGKVALDCVFLHELAHVLRGHLPFLDETDETGLDLEMSEDDNRVSSERVRDRYLCECEADKHAGRMLALSLWERMQSFPGAHQDDEASLEHLTLAYSAIFMLFAMMESNKKELTETYPVPLVRFHNITRRVQESFRQDTGLQIFQGMILAFSIVEKMGFKHLDYNIMQKYHQFETEDTAEMEELNRKLAGFRPK